jgi:hypothetical protein
LEKEFGHHKEILYTINLHKIQYITFSKPTTHSSLNQTTFSFFTAAISQQFFHSRHLTAAFSQLTAKPNVPLVPDDNIT